jgi:hypothetical protein
MSKVKAREAEAFKERETDQRPVVKYAVQWTQKSIHVEKERKGRKKSTKHQ